MKQIKTINDQYQTTDGGWIECRYTIDDKLPLQFIIKNENKETKISTYVTYLFLAEQSKDKNMEIIDTLGWYLANGFEYNN